MKYRHVLALVILAGVLLNTAAPVSAQQSADYKVIVNTANPVSAMEAKEVSRYFMKRRTTWDHGDEIQPVDLPVKSQVRAAFSKALHGKSAKAVNSYWQSQIFVGRASGPPEKKNDAEVIRYVRAHPGGIGYVSAAADVSGVKVLAVR